MLVLHGRQGGELPGAADSSAECARIVADSVRRKRAAGWLTDPPGPLIRLSTPLQACFIGLRALEQGLLNAGVHNVPPHAGAVVDRLLAGFAAAAGTAPPRAVCVLGARAGQDAVLYAEAFPDATVTLLDPEVPLRPVDAALPTLTALYHGRVRVETAGTTAAATALAQCNVAHVNLDGPDLGEHYRLWTGGRAAAAAGASTQGAGVTGVAWQDAALHLWQGSAHQRNDSRSVAILHKGSTSVETFVLEATRVLAAMGVDAGLSVPVGEQELLQLVVAEVPRRGTL